MEWTLNQIRELFEGYEVTRGCVHFGDRHTLDSDNFEAYVVVPGLWRSTQFGDSDGKLGLELGGCVWVSEEPSSDTLEGYKDALKRLLEHPYVVKCRKFGGAGGVSEAFKDLLEEELSKLGKWRCSDSVYKIENHGTVEKLCWPSFPKYDFRVKPLGGKETTVGVHLFDDDHEEAVKKVLSKLGKQSKPQPSFEDFVKAADKVELSRYHLDTGDKRSCGVFSGYWSTPHGELCLEVVYDTAGDRQGTTWTLDGEALVTDSGAWEELVVDADFQFPHYYSGHKAEEAWRKEFDGTEVSGLLKYHAENAE